MEERKKYVLAGNLFSGKKLQMLEENRKRREEKTAREDTAKLVPQFSKGLSGILQGFMQKTPGAYRKPCPETFSHLPDTTLMPLNTRFSTHISGTGLVSTSPPWIGATQPFHHSRLGSIHPAGSISWIQLATRHLGAKQGASTHGPALPAGCCSFPLPSKGTTGSTDLSVGKDRDTGPDPGSDLIAFTASPCSLSEGSPSLPKVLNSNSESCPHLIQKFSLNPPSRSQESDFQPPKAHSNPR